MSAKNWCFTINHPTPNERADLDYLSDDSHRASVHCNYIIFQLEKGELGTPHYQGYIQFSKRRTFNQVKALVGIRAHIEVAKGTPLQNKTYCTKPDDRLEEAIEYGEISGSQGKRNDILDFVNAFRENQLSTRDIIRDHPCILARYPRFVNTISTFYSSERRQSTFNPRPGWQTELTTHLSTEPDNRTVKWYYDQNGNSGKSYFATNYSYGTSDAGGVIRREFGYVINGGRHSDIYYGYKEENVVFFDWARDNQDGFPYVVVENFKNGYFLSTKYEVTRRYFNSPHIVVFSNFYPELNKLSEDRWSLVTL